MVALICVFLTANDVEHLFMFIDHFYFLFGEMSIQVLCLCLKWVICLLIAEL